MQKLLDKFLVPISLAVVLFKFSAPLFLFLVIFKIMFFAKIGILIDIINIGLIIGYIWLAKEDFIKFKDIFFNNKV